MQGCESVRGEPGHSLWAELGNKEFYFCYLLPHVYVFGRSHYLQFMTSLLLRGKQPEYNDSVNAPLLFTSSSYIRLHFPQFVIYLYLYIPIHWTHHIVLPPYINAPSMVHSGHFICLAKAGWGLTVAQYTTYSTGEHYPGLQISICCSRSHCRSLIYAAFILVMEDYTGRLGDCIVEMMSLIQTKGHSMKPLKAQTSTRREQNL